MKMCHSSAREGMLRATLNLLDPPGQSNPTGLVRCRRALSVVKYMRATSKDGPTITFHSFGPKVEGVINFVTAGTTIIKLSRPKCGVIPPIGTGNSIPVCRPEPTKTACRPVPDVGLGAAGGEIHSPCMSACSVCACFSAMQVDAPAASHVSDINDVSLNLAEAEVK